MTTISSAKQRIAISRISGLVLMNALIFQEVLSGSNEKVMPLQRMLDGNNIQRDLCKQWNMITTKINYYAIFHLAYEILSNIPSDRDVKSSLFDMVGKAQEIVQMRAALRHDLMGRIYHRLLVEKKYLGTYYTSIPAAALLLKVAIQKSKWDLDWGKLGDLKKIRVADLACGTGTLLMAAADAITDNYISSAAQENKPMNIAQLQKLLSEDIVYGYDVLPSAIHLTASTMALRAPESEYSKTNLYSLMLGGKEAHLGSLEYLYGKEAGIPEDLFGAQVMVKQMKGKGIEEQKLAPLPDLDLCVMNPPFTRSVGGNLLFGNLPNAERTKAQDKLKKLVKKKGTLANITAGLGSVFVAVADPHIKDMGYLALILPKALLSGVAWAKTRELIKIKYQVEYIIVSHDPKKWNFSENTSLSEVLLVAKKVGFENVDKDHKVIAVNLWRNPATSFEAQAIGQSIIQGECPIVDKGQGALSVMVGNSKVGEAIAFNWAKLRTNQDWILPCSFAQSDLIRVAHKLKDGKLWIPGSKPLMDVSIKPLGEFVKLGPDRRDIHDGFELSNSKTTYPAFWGHSSQSLFTISQKENKYLTPLSSAKKGRNLRKVEDLWPKSARLLLAERIRLNNTSLVAIRISKNVLSNVWWPAKVISKGNATLIEKSLVLWLNSTLGLILLLANRGETEGPWIDFKKPTYANLPVLDFHSISKEHLQKLSMCYDSVSKKSFLPIQDIVNDGTRHEIDDCISGIFDLGDVSNLRFLLSQEPIVSLRDLYVQ